MKRENLEEINSLCSILNDLEQKLQLIDYISYNSVYFDLELMISHDEITLNFDRQELNGCFDYDILKSNIESQISIIKQKLETL